jgi:hypothetical protein
MTEINESIRNEIDDMCKSLESAKEQFDLKFKNLFEDYLDQAFRNFYDTIEFDTRYNFERWIRNTADEIIIGLLAGETKWLKHQNIISDYDWIKIQQVRMAILKANGDEIANSTINALLKENAELKRENENLRKYR